MTGTGTKKVVLLGLMSVKPWAGVIWQTLHYLLGFRRLGYDTYYVEAHGCFPHMFSKHEADDGSVNVADFISGLMQRYDFGDHWAFEAWHSDGACYGMSRRQLHDVYESAEAIVNLCGATMPRPEHSRTGRLMYLETDPVQPQIELHDGVTATFDFLDQHSSYFTFAETYGRESCLLPTFERYPFGTTRQPIVTELWQSNAEAAGLFTTIGNWKQMGRELPFKGDVYHWSKHLEFLKFIDLPRRTDQRFELALSSSSYDEGDLVLLDENGWQVRDALAFSQDLDAYRDYILSSRAEFTVAKDQNVRLRTGWSSDRSASYLAASKPVITQDTGFGEVLPTGGGLFAFSSLEGILASVDAINSNYTKQSRAALEIAHDFFDSDVVLRRLLRDAGYD